MGPLLLVTALSAEPEPDRRPTVVVHGIAAAALATWSLRHPSVQESGLLPWALFATELAVVPVLPRIMEGRWSSAIVWSSVLVATATAGRIVNILSGDRMTVGTLGVAYGLPMALSGAALVTF